MDSFLLLTVLVETAFVLFCFFIVRNQEAELKALRARVDRLGRNPSQDPGPLTDHQLRWILGESATFPASKTLDRVQDAFERLLLEKYEAQERARTLPMVANKST